MLAVCALSMFLVGLDTTVVNVGLPAIGQGLGAGTRGLEWTVASPAPFHTFEHPPVVK